MKNQVHPAYVAGLIDGEGALTIQRSRTYGSYRITVDIGMTLKAKATLAALRGQYGGSLHMNRPATDRWAEAWMLSVGGADAAKMLNECMPYLHLKREQAHVCLAAEEVRQALPSSPTGKRRYWTEEAKRRCGVLKERLHELNAKGPTRTSQPGWFARVVAGHWVTPQQHMFGDLGSETFSGPWPRSGTTRNGYAYARPTSERATGESGSSSWPTPRANPAMAARITSSADPDRYPNLETVVLQRDPEARGGFLNPRFVEELMGFPIGWTDLKD